MTPRNTAPPLIAARPADDYYPTPASFADLVLRNIYPYGGTYRRILDPGAGHGAMALAAERHLRPGRLASVVAVETSQERCDALPDDWETHCEDFFAWAQGALAGRRFDLIYTNPPFRRWGEWVDACRGLLDPCGGTLAVLGFANLLGSQKRAAWWRSAPPSDVWVSPRRPKFVRTVSHNTDPRDTLIYVWRGCRTTRPPVLHWLEDTTP